MTKINIILISSLLTIAFSFSQVDGYDVIQDKIVVKINDDFAPKLGSENPNDLRMFLQALSTKFDKAPWMINNWKKAELKVGMNKEDIINRAVKIGTYDISIEPYEDCCSYFHPPNPETKANLKRINSIEKFMKY